MFDFLTDAIPGKLPIFWALLFEFGKDIASGKGMTSPCGHASLASKFKLFFKNIFYLKYNCIRDFRKKLYIYYFSNLNYP